MEADLARAQREVEALIAVGLYRVKVNAIKDRVRRLYREYEGYLKPNEEVREILAREIPGKVRLSQEVVELRRAETH